VSFTGKRDRIQIVADILGSCKRPQTQTYIRRKTNISYGVLQSCITQLLLRQWLEQSEEDYNQKKLTVTSKGMVFLDKWDELQKMVAQKNGKLKAPSVGVQAVMAKSR
jgi:predicted transcriptional regulator